MTNSADSALRRAESAFRLSSKPMILGGALVGAGSLLGLAGLMISGSALALALRDWAGRQEVPPGELARVKWAQARAATAAGATVWRNGTREEAARHS